MSSRIAAAAAFLGILLLAPAWLLLTMLGANGMNTHQGEWLLGGIGAYLLLALFVAPWQVLRLAQRWQAKRSPTLAAIAAWIATACVVLFGLAVLTVVLLMAVSELP